MAGQVNLSGKVRAGHDQNGATSGWARASRFNGRMISAASTVAS
ncbi:hypothetical protein [Spongiactinospora rosea]|nr:hypothetical protein [Spongiactinospora rosea]